MKFSYSLLKTLVPKLPPAAKLVAALNTYSFEVEEAEGDLIDVKLPANIYSYASSHIGLAREAAIIFGLKLKNRLRVEKNLPKKKRSLAVAIEAEDLCARYSGRVFELPNKARPLPAAMTKALATCGINSVNPVVDIMNYVMLLTGQPLHAFDCDSLAKSVVADHGSRVTLFVRRSKKGESIETLDKKKVDLPEGTLVIADARGPQAIAGIKGGLASGVERETRRIIVEAANFDASQIYRASRKLGIMTDASIRFSHHLSPALVDSGMARAAELLEKLLGAKLVDAADVYPRPAKDTMVEFDLGAYAKLIGDSVVATDAKRYFEALGFTATPKTKKGAMTFMVRVPAWRNDIESFPDLAEEIARLEGYGEILPEPPLAWLIPSEEDPVFLLKDEVRHLLVRLGVDEVYTYSFASEADFADTLPFFAAGDAPVFLANPASEDKRILRPALMPLLRRSLLDNSRFAEQVRIFEVGKVFRMRRSAVAEKLVLGVALAAKREPVLVREAKGIADALFRQMGIDAAWEAGRGFALAASGDRRIAELREADLGKGLRGAFLEIDLEAADRSRTRGAKFSPLPKFPGTIRDISFFIKKGNAIGDVLEAILSGGYAHLADADLVDQYTDPKLSGRLGLTVRLVFQAHDRTLTDEEVSAEVLKVSSMLKDRFQADLR